MRILLMTPGATLAISSLAVAADPLIGNWDLRLSKSTMAEQITVIDLGLNKFSSTRGPGSHT